MSKIALLVLLLSVSQSLAAILAIDYGSEWMKASLIKPGVPFDVLLNRDSKRKIQSTVAWKNADRLFGSDASNIAPRFPSDSFSFLKTLQGVPFDSPQVEYYNTLSTTAADLVPTTRGTIAVRRPNGTEWSVEELIAMQLAYVKDLAETNSGAASGGAGAGASLGGVTFGGDRDVVQDVVLSVPAYFTQFAREALVDAVELAGMKVLALVDDGAAVAVNYAMTRSFPVSPSREIHVIYDAGASSIRATVVSFSTVPASNSKSKDTKTKDKEHTQITVLGHGFDVSAGGTELDRRLRDMLVQDFIAKHGGGKKSEGFRDIRTDKRGMAKMWKEAGRVKAILSANVEAGVNIESAAFDIDYRSRITRQEFEEACSDLKAKFSQPIFDALRNAGVSLDEVTSVILTGGHSRTPMVQAAVKSAVGEGKIATNVNADEAVALGSAFYGASISRQFRSAKDIRVQDVSAFDVMVSYPTESKDKKTTSSSAKSVPTSSSASASSDESEAAAGIAEGDESENAENAIILEDDSQTPQAILPQPSAASASASSSIFPMLKSSRIINTLVFPAGTKLGSRKTLTFKRKSDFEIKMGYKSAPAVGLPTEILEASITGIGEAYANLTERGATDVVVKAFVTLLESGIAAVDSAVMYGEMKVKDTSITGKLKGLFGGSGSGSASTSESETSEADSNNETDSDSEAANTTETTSAENNATQGDAPVNEKPGKASQKTSDTIKLDVEVKSLSMPSMTPEEIRVSRRKLSAIDHAEAAQRRREEARNTLEAYLYRLRDHLEYDEDSAFMRCSKEEERAAIREKLEETLEWMQVEADNADTFGFMDRRHALEQLERPIQHRSKEIDQFPQALNNSQKWNLATRGFLEDARANLTVEDPLGLPPRFTIEELDALEKTLTEHEAWLNEWVEKQKSVKPNEDPVILTTEMQARAKVLETQLQKLVTRRRPLPRRTTSTSTWTPPTTSAASQEKAEKNSEKMSTTTLPTDPTHTTHDEL